MLESCGQIAEIPQLAPASHQRTKTIAIAPTTVSILSSLVEDHRATNPNDLYDHSNFLPLMVGIFWA
jgi:hypothetical protein